MKINIKRAYEPPARGDGLRVLVDRLWPRGKGRDDLKIDLWMKGIAPSERLRKWFSHDPERWEEFMDHYIEELEGNAEEGGRLLNETRKRTVTLVYSAKDEQRNNAAVLKGYLEREKDRMTTGKAA